MLSADPEVWRRLHEDITELRNTCVERMALGGCRSWEEYQRDVGYVRALDQVVGAAQDLLGRLSGTPEEEEED